MQSNAYITPALGKAGTIARLNPVPQHFPFIAEGAGVTAGHFCFAGTDAETQVKALGEAGAKPVGLVIKEGYQPNLGAGSLILNDGENVAVLVKGCAYIEAGSTGATHGQVVGVNPTTGAIEFKDTAEALTEGSVDTGFVVKTAGTANTVVEIANV